jgi:uncharacterized protein YprB with RNaseH-like and TPR domain
MSVADRLREILGAPQNGGRTAAPARIAAAPQSTDVARLLGGAWRIDGHARAFVVERRYPPQAHHGSTQVGEFARAIQKGVRAASMLVGGDEIAPPLTFFDLETTGLNGGAGTLAFLVGCASFDDDGGFSVRQHLLISQADEQPMLQFLGAELSRTGALVSFNGKSFDAPLLEMRYLFHRLPWPAPGMHLDLLHPSRRFWKPDEPAGEGTCALSTLEERVLGVRRGADIAGIDIPGRYFEFVRSGDPRGLASVLEHNRRDLLSLAGLAARLLHLLAEGPDAARDGREALALGRIYATSRLGTSASAAYQYALALSRPASLLRIEVLRALADVSRQAREHQTAAQCWQQLLEAPECPGAVAHEAARALAIHHEHRLRDLHGARAFAMRSLQEAGRPSRAEALQYRLARIERKMAALQARRADGVLPLQL